MGVFVVDTNFFIEGHLRLFPPDIFTGYWSRISQLAHEGKIISIDKVGEEIFRNEDSISEWCQEFLPPHFFKDTSSVLGSYIQVVQWADSKSDHYKRTAISEFSETGRADAWLVSYCHSDLNGRILVTNETSEHDRKSKIKIPEVCHPFGVTCITPVDMLRQLGERF